MYCVLQLHADINSVVVQMQADIFRHRHVLCITSTQTYNVFYICLYTLPAIPLINVHGVYLIDLTLTLIKHQITD